VNNKRKKRKSKHLEKHHHHNIISFGTSNINSMLMEQQILL